MTDPAAQPLVWISKWVDYSDKYGFGYQLCDDGVGIMFNDKSRIVLLANQKLVRPTKLIFLFPSVHDRCSFGMIDILTSFSGTFIT